MMTLLIKKRGLKMAITEKLQVITNPEDPETAGAKQWVRNLARHLKDPDDVEAFEAFRRQSLYDCGAVQRPKPKLASSANDVSR